MPRFVLSLPVSNNSLLRAALTLALLTVAGVSARYLLVTPSAGAAAAPAPATAALISPSPADSPTPLEVERFTIRPTGFDPAGITRPAGRFILAVDNRSGLRELTLRLSDGEGRRLREVRVPRGQLGWRLTLDARAGSYVLTEADHPDWVCRVTITAR
jgi:hypothetical protein